ncbi:MAG: hypothetical protein WDW38_010722 [Sanguina aurantia]
MHTLSGVAASTNRLRGTKLILAAGTEDTWRELDKKVNRYPGQREFKVIGEVVGTGGPQYRSAMVSAVSDVVGVVHLECVAERYSSGAKYISVTVGPVWLTDGDQVIQIFANMKQDPRTRWII